LCVYIFICVFCVCLHTRTRIRLKGTQELILLPDFQMAGDGF
jgi:hypothetical protein